MRSGLRLTDPVPGPTPDRIGPGTLFPARSGSADTAWAHALVVVRPQPATESIQGKR